MKLPVIQSLWVGAPLSNFEKLCIQSFLDHGHEFHLYTYADIGGIPNGTTVKDGNEILSEKEIYLHGRSKSFGPFSDWFRYALLYKNGGWWVDMDEVCLKPFDFTDEIVFGNGQPGIINTGVLAFPKGSEIMKNLAYACHNPQADMPWDDAVKLTEKRGRRYSFTRRNELPFMELAYLFGDAIRHYNLTDKALPFTVFYPIDWPHWPYLFNNSFPKGNLYPDTYGVHLWNDKLRSQDGFKNAQFDNESLFEQLKAKHNLPQIAGTKRITSDEVNEIYIRPLIRAGKASIRRKKRARVIKIIAFVSLIALTIFLVLRVK